MSYLEDWKKRRIEYWQPVIYFKNGQSPLLDFNICPKNACTSIKSYYSWTRDHNWVHTYKSDDPYVLKLKSMGVLDDNDVNHLNNFVYYHHLNIKRVNRVKLWLNEPTTTFNDFFREGSVRIAIKRDPVKRFVSGYMQIWKQTAFGSFKKHSYNIDELLDLLESKEYWNEHLTSQTFWMGTPDRYHRIFDISQTKDCILYMNRILKFKTIPPEIHSMKSIHEKPELTRKQIDRIESLYIEDYENGWY